MASSLRTLNCGNTTGSSTVSGAQPRARSHRGPPRADDNDGPAVQALPPAAVARTLNHPTVASAAQGMNEKNEKNVAKNQENLATVLSLVDYFFDHRGVLNGPQRRKFRGMLGDKHFPKVEKLLTPIQSEELAQAKVYLAATFASDQHHEAPLVRVAKVEDVGTSVCAPSSPVVSAACLNSFTLSSMIIEAEAQLKDLKEQLAKAVADEVEAAEDAEAIAKCVEERKAAKAAKAAAAAKAAVAGSE